MLLAYSFVRFFMKSYVKNNYHTHTMRCKHAVGEDKEYVEAAIAAGIQELGFSDHIPMPVDDERMNRIRMSRAEVDDYMDSILSLKREYRNDISIKVGFEGEYYAPLFHDQMKLLEQYPYDYLILGQHFLEVDGEGEYTGWESKDKKWITTYVDTCVEALETGAYSYLCHPDLIHFIGDDAYWDMEMRRLCLYCKEKNIPIAMTAHDLNPICPASIMLYDGKPCEDCLTKGYTQCIKKKCNKGSTLKSIIGYAEKKYYDCHKVFKKVDCIISPSEFNKNQLIKGKLNCNDIKVIHNFVNKSEHKDYVLGDYAFYFGRLSKEKGILNLIEAIKDIPDSKLLIAGDGPEKENIEAYIKKHNLGDRITLLGYQNQDSIREYIRNSRFVVVPSVCNENCPYSVLETLEIGKPVIGSRIGGIPELIEDGENGFLYKFDNVNELKKKLEILFSQDEIVDKFSAKSHELYESNYSPDAYYDKLMKIYCNYIKK